MEYFERLSKVKDLVMETVVGMPLVTREIFCPTINEGEFKFAPKLVVDIGISTPQLKIERWSMILKNT